MNNSKSLRIHYSWVILLLASLIVFGSIGLGRMGYTMILPQMQSGLKFSNTEAGAIATGNFIGYLIFAFIGGFLASHYNARKVVLLSMLTVALFMLLTASSGRFRSAFIYRTITGLGSGGCFVPTMGIVAGWFAANKRGFASGLAIGGNSLGVILTGYIVPLAMNFSTDEGWRYCWAILGVIMLLTLIPVYFFLYATPADKGLKPFGVSQGNSTSEHHITTIGDEIVSWRAFSKSSTVWMLAFIYFTFGISYIIYMTFFAKYLQSEVGYSAAAAGKLWQLIGMVGIVSGIIWGWISDILGRKYGLAFVYFLQGASYLIFALCKNPLGATFSSVIFGITAWSVPAIMASSCADHLGAKMASAGLGFITLIFGIGQAVGPTVGGWFADKFGSFSQAFMLGAAFAFIGCAVSFMLNKPIEKFISNPNKR